MNFNSIIGGGMAAAALTAAALTAEALSAAAGQAFIGPDLGLGALGVAGAGGVAEARGIFSPCPSSRPCRVRRTPQP